MARLPFLLTIISFFAGSTCGWAHPVSYIDGWASVRSDGRIHVRLKVFVHDVARQHALSDDRMSDDRMSADEFREAIELHSDFLLNSLQIYQGGELLKGEIQSSPRWNPATTHIDLATEGAVRLQWDLTFPTRGGHIESLCVTHQLMAADAPDGGELRLQLRSAGAQRRVSAVIPPQRPVTIVVPQKTAKDNPNDPNAAVSNLIVTPTAVIHEFMAPLALMRCGSPQLDACIAAGLRGQSQHLTLSADAAAEVRIALETWMRRHVSLHAANAPSLLRAEAIHIEFLPALFTASDESEPLSFSSEVPVFGATVGVRSEYLCGPGDDGLALHFAESPGDFDELLVNIVTPRQQQTFTVQPNTEPRAPVLSFEWRPSEEQSAASHTALALSASQLAAAPAAVRPLLKRPKSLPLAVIGGTILAGSLAISIAGIFGLLATRRRKTAAGIAMIALACGLFSVRTTPAADKAALRKHTQWLLEGIYRTTSGLDSGHAVSQLDHFLDADLAETVYLSAVRSLASSGQETWIGVRSVGVDTVHQTDVRARDWIEIDCSWTVAGNVHHWGHLHQRTLSSSGQLTLRKREGHWKISRMTLTERGATVTSHNGESNPPEKLHAFQSADEPPDGLSIYCDFVTRSVSKGTKIRR